VTLLGEREPAARAAALVRFVSPLLTVLLR
jgi:hypothetical protein